MTTTFSTQFDNSFDTVFTNTTHTLTTILPQFDHKICGALLKNAGDDALRPGELVGRGGEGVARAGVGATPWYQRWSPAFLWASRFLEPLRKTTRTCSRPTSDPSLG